MRICLISREYPPDTGWGGIGTFTYHIVHGLKGLGHDVEVVSLAGSSDSVALTIDDGIRVHRAQPLTIGDETGLLNFCLPVSRPMLQELSGLWKKFLAVHEEKPFDIAEAPEHFAEGAFVAAAKPVPLVIRLHTPHSKLLSERFHNFVPSFDHQFLSMVERMAMINADQLVSPSEDLAQYVANDLSYPLDQIAIIRNPVDAAKFCPEGRKALTSDGRRTVLFVGRLEERKGIHYLVEAIPKVLRRIQNVRFVIIGSDTMTAQGNTSVLTELTRSLGSSQSSEAVTFIPRVPLSEMADYYRSADILALPSLYDNAPCTALEAMSCGVPVISTTAGGTKEYVVHDQCGLIVSPRNAEALADALVSLLGSDSERARMGENSRRRVLDNFTTDKIAQQTADLYAQVAQRAAQERLSGRTALYMKDPAHLLDDFMTVIGASEKTLYDLVFVHSMKFRLEHKLKLVRKHPARILAKLLASPAKQP